MRAAAAAVAPVLGSLLRRCCRARLLLRYYQRCAALPPVPPLAQARAAPWLGALLRWMPQAPPLARRDPYETMACPPSRTPTTADGISSGKVTWIEKLPGGAAPAPPISRSDEDFEQLGVEFVYGPEGIDLSELNDLFERVRSAGTAHATTASGAHAAALLRRWAWQALRAHWQP